MEGLKKLSTAITAIYRIYSSHIFYFKRDACSITAQEGASSTALDGQLSTNAILIRLKSEVMDQFLLEFS